jgi:hypothetical protein
MERFPREELDASRRDESLQAKMRREVEATKRANPRVTCRECRSRDNLVWFFFSSPPKTWQMGAGRAGVIAFCDVHERQVMFLPHARS